MKTHIISLFIVVTVYMKAVNFARINLTRNFTRLKRAGDLSVMEEEKNNKVLEVFEWIEERWVEILVFLFLLISVGKCALE